MADWQVIGPRIVLIVVLLVTNVALVGALSTSSTEYGPYNHEWDGTSDLRSTVSGSVPDSSVAIDATAYERLNASGSVALIVAPQDQYGAGATARVRQFVTRGGTLVVAAESNRTNGLLADIGAQARIGDRPLRDEQSNYRDPSLPVATNVSDHPLLKGIESITLNHAATVEPNNVTVLVRTASTAYLDRNRNGTFDPDESVGSWPVATVESVGTGRVIVVSDASVFTNALLDQSDNREFVEKIVANNHTVLLDQSQGSLPPVPYAAIVIRTTPLVQFGLGIAAFGLLGFVALGGPKRLWERRQDIWGKRQSQSDVTLSGDEIVQYLTTAHPDWDDQRIQRVTKALNRRREDSNDND